SGDGLVDLLVTGTDARRLGAGDLELQQHQSLEHLAFEYVTRRQLFLAASVLTQDIGNGTVELALEDHVLVDDRGDTVDRLQLLRRKRCGQQCSDKETREYFLHGIGSRELSRSPVVTEDGGTR